MIAYSPTLYVTTLFFILCADITFDCTIDPRPGIRIIETRKFFFCVNITNDAMIGSELQVSLHPMLSYFPNSRNSESRDYFVATYGEGTLYSCNFASSSFLALIAQ